MAWQGKERDNAIDNATHAAAHELEQALRRPLSDLELSALNDAITEYLMVLKLKQTKVDPLVEAANNALALQEPI